MIYLGMCLMLTQKMSIDDMFKSIFGIVRQRTPVYLPSTWCEYLQIEGSNARLSMRVFILLKRHVASESLERLQRILKSIKNKTLMQRCLINFISTNRLDSSLLGIPVSPLYLTEKALIEVAKSKHIPLAMHVLQARYDQKNDTIEMVKWHLIFFIYNGSKKRFERTEDLKPYQLVIALTNIWYEGSEASVNFGENFLERPFDLENYIDVLKAHPELTERLEKIKSIFCDRTDMYRKQVSLEFLKCFEYLKMKEQFDFHPNANDVFEKIKRMSFMYCIHFYPSTCATQIQFNDELNASTWNKRLRFENHPACQVKIHNQGL